ncbi:MAG TPA: DUF3515 domain-containing protein [Jatrophihabitantaceae bacterium]|nr:DUF3515 domain-containing protein [Jatrophihabitantaceae bacterium]
MRRRAADPVRRRAALIATAVTVPIVLVVALLLGHLQHKNPAPVRSGSPAALAPVTVAAPPANSAADAPCTKLLGVLPLSLNGLAVRPALSTWTYVVAWGDPAIVLRCGVPRPAALTPGSSAQTIGIDGVYWLPAQQKKQTVWTVIDRAAYIEVTVPSSYAQPPLAVISDALASVLPAVCVVDPAVTDPTKLCTRR